MDSHRPRIRALTSLLLVGALRVPADQASAGVDAHTAIITAGQQARQFNDVDTFTAREPPSQERSAGAVGW